MESRIRRSLGLFDIPAGIVAVGLSEAMGPPGRRGK